MDFNFPDPSRNILLRTASQNDLMELKKERIVHAAGEVFRRDHRIADDECRDPGIFVRGNTHSHFPAQRMSENCGAAGNNLLQESRDILRVLSDTVATTDSARSTVASQVQCE